MANIGKTEVDAASLEIVSQLVNLNLQRSLVMPGKLLDLSSEAQPGVDLIKIRKFTDLSVQTKAENVDISYTASTKSTDDLALDQHKYVAFLMEEFAKIQAPQSFMEELSSNAAIKIAQDYDSYLISTVEGGAAIGSLASPGVVAKSDFIDARQALDAANVPMQDRYVGLHPDRYAEVLALADFVEADKYGSSNIPMGVVGMIFGMKVVVNTGFTAAQLLAWERSCAAGAIQLSPSVRAQYDVDALGDKWALHTIYGAQMLNSSKAIKLT